MRTAAVVGSLMLLSALVACNDATGPDEAPTPLGVDFGFALGDPFNHHAQGPLSSIDSPLQSEFAVAFPDSVGGFVLVSYDADGSNLFILQGLTAATGEVACGPVEEGAACHARLFENVRIEDGIALVDGRFDLVEGTLTLTLVGPDELGGTFEARMDRTSPEGTPQSFQIVNGTVRVDYLDEQVASGGLGCLIALTGGGGACDQG